MGGEANVTRHSFAGRGTGGLYAGIVHIGFYVFARTNILSVQAFAGGSGSNIIHGTIACVITMVASAVLTYLFGFHEGESGGVGPLISTPGQRPGVEAHINKERPIMSRMIK